MSESRSIWKTIGIWAAGIVVVVVVAHTVLVGGTRRRVEAEIAHIRAQGEPVTMKDLAGPKVPDSRNGAVIYEQAIQMFKSPAIQSDKDAVEKFDISTTDPREWAAIEQSLQKLAPVKALLADAQAKPDCRFKVDWDAGIAALFPHYAPMRAFARVLRVDAAANARAGRVDEALKSTKLAYGVSESIGHEPILIGQLVRIAVLAITNDGLQTMMQSTRLTEKQAKDLFDYLGRVDIAQGHVNAMVGERAFGLWTFDHMQELGVGGVSNFVGPGSQGFDPTSLIASYPLRPLLNVDQAAYLRFMREQVEQSKLSVLEMRKKGIKPIDELSLPKYAFLSRIMMPVFSRARAATDKAVAQLAVVRGALALEAYRSRYGTFPASLDDVKSKLGWKLPLDPFSGRDLVYKRSAGGFVLYSLGLNMKDDGGNGTLTASGDPNDPSDVVWEYGTVLP